jgi:hypothetical protein
MLPELLSLKQTVQTSSVMPPLSSTIIRHMCLFMSFPVASALLYPSNASPDSSLPASSAPHLGLSRGNAPQHYPSRPDAMSRRLKELAEADIPLFDSNGYLVYPNGSLLSNHPDSQLQRKTVLFPSELGNSFATDLQAAGASSTWTFLHPMYAEAASDLGVPVEHMKWLLTELGVLDFPLPVRMVRSVRSQAIRQSDDQDNLHAVQSHTTNNDIQSLEGLGCKQDLHPVLLVQDWHCPALCDQISCIVDEASALSTKLLRKKSRHEKSSNLQPSSTWSCSAKLHHALRLLARALCHNWHVIGQTMHAHVLINDGRPMAAGLQLGSQSGPGAKQMECSSAEMQQQAGSAQPLMTIPSTLCLFLRDKAWLVNSRGMCPVYKRAQIGVYLILPSSSTAFTF